MRVHGGVIEARQDLAYGGDALVKGVEDLLRGCGLGELEVWWRDLVLLSAADDSSGHEGEVVCELTSGQGPGVRLPSELVFGKALEELPRDRRLSFKFCEQGLRNGHGFSFRVCVFKAVDWVAMQELPLLRAATCAWPRLVCERGRALRPSLCSSLPCARRERSLARCGGR